MKKHLGTALIILILITGLALFLYPVIGNMRNNAQSSRAIARYADAIESLEDRGRQEALASAEQYNRVLYQSSRGDAVSPGDIAAGDYDSQLDLSEGGMMAYIDIPKIDCRLPIYHGVDAETLESYIGHLPSSSLPVGGASTHCVLTGHTGMPSARLLTDLTKLEIGDRFTVTTLDRTLTYEVERIDVVLPDETNLLAIEDGRDLCTLVTCTPYGVNTHRLLVRGRRVSENTPSAQDDIPERTFADRIAENPVMVALAAILLLLLIIFAATRKTYNKQERGR